MGSSAPRSSRAPGALVDAAAATLVTALADRRWFGAKGRVIAGVSPVDHAVVPGTTGVLALFRVAFTSGEPEVYTTPLVERDGQPADALDDPGFCAGLIEHVRVGTTLRGRHGVFRFAATDALAEILPGPSTQVVHVTTEQSNTSVIVGGQVILKVFRRLEAGPSPEVEVTEFLTRETAFRGTPRLAGSIVYETPDREATTVAIVQEFVPNQGDAWTAVQAHLDEYCSTIVTETTGAADAAFARTLAAADAKEARALGGLTGQLHMALASAKAGSPLAPEPITSTDLSTWLDAMHAHLDRSLASLQATLDALPAEVRAVAQRVLAQAPRLRDALTALQTVGTEAVTKLRIHGDYHLGQVLRTELGFTILDFEGEPARTLAERRAKQSALKDVAGMLRSFAYAVRAAVLHARETSPDDRTLEERLVPWLESWENGVRAAFLEGYLAETAGRGASFLPRRREVLEAALRAYELDKAVYELSYELSHRPAWVRVPLEGLERASAEVPRVEVVQAHPADGPFSFIACIELREFVGARAADERQLAELIEQVPAASIQYHTHGFLLRHKFVAGIYPNDFANWVGVHVRDQVLGERLAMIDPAEFADLEALRQEFVAVIDEHLRRLAIVPRVVSAEPFDFVRSTLVQIPTAIEAGTLEEFREALLEVDASAIYFHLVEARMRLGRGDNDFARWLERRLGLGTLAERVRTLNPYTGSLERTRTRLIQLCDEALAPGTGR